MKRVSVILVVVLALAAMLFWFFAPARVATPTPATGITLPSPSATPGLPSTFGAPATTAVAASPTKAPQAASSAPTPSSAQTYPNAAALEPARETSRLSRTPQGAWAERVPAPADYAAALPAVHATALAEFLARFPDLDPTEVQHFAEATLRQRATYGDTLDENEATAFTAWLQPMEQMQQSAVVARAALVGVVMHGSEPVNLDGDTRGFSLVGFEGVKPVYSFTQNAAAAESTGANLVRLVPSYDTQLASPADGTGLYVNVNDHGTIFDENPEFQLPSSGGTRVVYKEINDSGSRDHMTHCAGTVGAWGYTANLMGMAPRVWIRSHIQQSTSDIIIHGMMWPGQNHTVTNPRNGETELKSVMGTTSLGWDYTGPYDYSAVSFDTTLRDYPYYIHFYAAANNGSAYNTLSAGNTMSKNGVTIGSVSDTVRDASGTYTSGGSISGFSSRGPTFDGRIKPDLTANGDGLTSPTSATGTGSKSGTSMATPNASGSTTLLIDYLRKKLPGHFVRSSTLKALLVNTATDRGNAASRSDILEKGYIG